MQDYYMDDQHCIDRLFDKWKQYRTLIVAYEFDNTVFDPTNSGMEFSNVISILRQCKELGFHLILFTSYGESRFAEIESYLRSHDIPFDGINANAQSIEFDGRKVHYNILLDDRAGLKAAYDQLQVVVQKVRAELNVDGIMLQQF